VEKKVVVLNFDRFSMQLFDSRAEAVAPKATATNSQLPACDSLRGGTGMWKSDGTRSTERTGEEHLCG
jgi:hypothetical protein